MERTRKIWGERVLLRKDSTHANSLLSIDPGMECSWHRHQAKFNLFYVISGKVGIVTEEPGLGKQETSLTAGQCFTTKPGQWHKFVAYEHSLVIEEMYVDYDEGDIERQTTGGYRSPLGKERRRADSYATYVEDGDGYRCTGCEKTFLSLAEPVGAVCPWCKRTFVLVEGLNV